MHDDIVTAYPPTEVRVRAIMAEHQDYTLFIDTLNNILTNFAGGIQVLANTADNLSKLAEEVQAEIDVLNGNWNIKDVSPTKIE